MKIVRREGFKWINLRSLQNIERVIRIIKQKYFFGEDIKHFNPLINLFLVYLFSWVQFLPAAQQTHKGNPRWFREIRALRAISKAICLNSLLCEDWVVPHTSTFPSCAAVNYQTLYFASLSVLVTNTTTDAVCYRLYIFSKLIRPRLT